MRRTAGENLVTEDGQLPGVDDGLKEGGHALAADDVAQLARELFLSLLLGIPDRVGGRLHPLIDLTLQANLRSIVDAGDAHEESDLPLLHGWKLRAHGLDQLLTEIVGDGVERVLLAQIRSAG